MIKHPFKVFGIRLVREDDYQGLIHIMRQSIVLKKVNDSMVAAKGNG